MGGGTCTTSTTQNSNHHKGERERQTGREGGINTRLSRPDQARQDKTEAENAASGSRLAKKTFCNVTKQRNTSVTTVNMCANGIGVEASNCLNIQPIAQCSRRGKSYAHSFSFFANIRNSLI